MSYHQINEILGFRANENNTAFKIVLSRFHVGFVKRHTETYNFGTTLYCFGRDVIFDDIGKYS